MSSFPSYTNETLDDGSLLSFHGNDIFMNQIHLEIRPMNQPASKIISFGNGTVTAASGKEKTKHEADSSSNEGIIRSRNSFKAQDHVLAERKRREKLSQRIIALSAAIPTLKKMDKATVLEDAVKYIKQLEQRIEMLEKEAAMESVVVVKRSQVSVDEDDASSSYEIASNKQKLDPKLLEIEARVSEKYVLIRVHCQRRTDCITTILNRMEKTNLTVLSNSIMQFGSSRLDITIVAQIEAEFDMTIEELVRKLRQDLLHSM